MEDENKNKSNVFLKKSQIDFLPEYINLYQKCFPNALHLNKSYLTWLYQDNPSGSLVGADAWCGDEVVGQVVAIPGEYILNGKLARGLLAVNVAVHPEFQGRFLFKKLGIKTCEYGAENGYEFVIGVANKVPTPGWVRQMDFQLVQPLEALLGFGNLNINWNSIVSVEQLKHKWSKESLQWRISNPNNPIYVRRSEERLQCYASAKGKMLAVYTELSPCLKVNNIEDTVCRFFSPLRLF
ncbi:MAG: GNAT family N-acetyltransferase [Chthoniobacterales bacterium]|nr:GNAT family N-acetyltransferase [Chthoniobacterales bacterium]